MTSRSPPVRPIHRHGIPHSVISLSNAPSCAAVTVTSTRDGPSPNSSTSARPAPGATTSHPSGAGPVTAGDITESADVEIVNPELLLLTLDSDAGSIEMDLTVETGVGYRPAEHAEDLPIGIIPVDAIFTPVRRVNFIVSDTRVGQMTNFDRLTLEIETDGTTTPKAALSSAAEILVQEFSRFAEIGRRPLPGSEDAPALVSANLLDAPIEELDLPMRAYNSLKRNNITKIGQLLALGDDELLRMRNFGKKSLDEMKERLALRGFIVPESPAGSADESDLPAAAELDEAVAAELDREG